MPVLSTLNPNSANTRPPLFSTSANLERLLISYARDVQQETGEPVRLPTACAEPGFLERDETPFIGTQITDIVNIVSDKLLQFISTTLSVPLASLKIVSVSSLSLALMAFVTQVINACKNPTTLCTKWVLPIMSLIQVGTNIAMVALSFGIDEFSAEKCTEQLTALINAYTTDGTTLDDYAMQRVAHRNAWDPSYILRVCINLLTYAICVGCRISGVEVRTLNGILTLREKTKTLSKDLREIAAEVLKDLFDYDVDVCTSVTLVMQDLIARTGEMSRTPEIDFLVNPTKAVALESLLKEIETLQSAKMSEAQARAYAQAKTLLNNQYQALNKTHLTIKSLGRNNERPVTVGIVLNGRAGIGKSNFAKWFMRKIAKLMGYSPDIYNLEMGPNGSYAEIYKRESLGIYNEFGKSHDNTNAVYNINSIISNDPVNLEAAECAFKIQPCVLRLVILTVNRRDLAFRHELVEDANVAMITRMIEVDVEDDFFEGRGQPNAHRTPDYSHLRLVWKKLANPMPERLDDCRDRVRINYNVEEFTKLIIQKLCSNEVQYLSEQIETCEAGNSILESMRARRDQLIALSEQNVPRPNSNNTSFFVARWQGPKGFGKTSQSKTFIRTMKSAFKLDTYHLQDTGFAVVPKVTKPSIFVIDDIPITPENAINYHAWINTIPTNSIVLIITNTVVPPEPITRFSQRHVATCMGEPLSWNTTTVSDLLSAARKMVQTPVVSAFHLDNYPKIRKVLDVAPGLARRLGFAGLQLVDNEYYDPPPHSGICLTVGKQDYINLASAGAIDLAFETGKAYIDYMRSTDEFLILNQEPPVTDYDIWIEVRDFSLFKQKASNERGYVDMYTHRDDPAGQIHIHPQSIQRLISCTDVSTWVIPDIGEESQMLQVSLRYIYRLNNAFPGVTLKITCGGRAVVFHNNIVYDTAVILEDDITVRDSMLYFQHIPIPPTAIARIKVTGIRSGRPLEIPELSPAQIITVLKYIESHKFDENMYMYNTALELLEANLSKAEQFTNSKCWLWLCTDSVVRNILFGCLTGITVLGAAYGIYKLCATNVGEEEEQDPDHVPQPNTFPEDREAHRRTRDNREKARRADPIVYNWRRPNNTEAKVPTRLINPETASKDDLQAFVKRMVKPTKNMVHSELHVSKNPHLAAVINKLRKNVCRVSTLNGICHGLVICNRFVLTVKHTIHNCDNIAVIWSPSTSLEDKLYPAKVVATDHSRDIAILEIEDLTFPEGANILSYIVRSDLMDTWRSDAIYVRPLETTEIVYGQAYHSDKYRVPLGSSNDPSWRPTMYYDFTPIHLGIGANQVRKGDCGLPLIQCIEGNYFIIGINCAVSLIGEANFSMISTEILTKLTLLKPIKNALGPEDLATESFKLLPIRANIPNYNQFLEEIQDATKYDNVPEIDTLGYAKPFHLISNPKHSRVLVVPPECPVKTTSGQSWLKDSSIPDTIGDKMYKDVSGKPSLHLTQAIKNFKRLPFLLDPQEFEENAHITAQYVAQHLGTNHSLLRTHEVINGILGEPLKNMPLATSAGPYMKIKYKIQDKRALFDINSKPGAPVTYGFARTPAGKELAEDYYAGIHSIENGEAPVFMIKDNLKVELLPEEKILAGESRLFCECDLVTNMWLRRYTGSMTSAMVENHPWLGIATGMNPYLFPTFTHKHTPSRYTVICSDLKRMDKTLHPSFNWLYILCVRECSRDTVAYHCDGIWNALTVMLSTTLHFNNGILYQVTGGNPSGLFGTSQLNSIAVLFVIIKEYRRVTLNLGLRTFSRVQFDTDVKKEILGDDLRLRTNPELGITYDTIFEAFTECGLQCVPSKTPGGELGDFCSRAYHWSEEHQVIFPRLKKNTIVDLVLWIRLDDKETMVANFKMACMESSFWEESFFKDINKAVQLQLETFRIKDFPFFNYHDHRTHFARYVRGEESKPTLTDVGPNFVIDKLYEDNAIIRSMDYVGALLALYAQNHEEFDGTTTTTRDSNTNEWKYTLSIRGDTFTGSALKKSAAKNEAYRQAFESENAKRAQPNSGHTGPWHKHSLRYRTEPSSHGVHRVLACYIDDRRVCELRKRPDDIDEDTPEECISTLVEQHIQQLRRSADRMPDFLEYDPDYATSSDDDSVYLTFPWHRHQCKRCGSAYKHLHHYRYKDHAQFPDQCPNVMCDWYHQGNNPTQSQEIE